VVISASTCRPTAAASSTCCFQRVKFGAAAADTFEISPLKGQQFGAERRQIQLCFRKLGLQPRKLFQLAVQFFLLPRMKTARSHLGRGTRKSQIGCHALSPQ